MSEENPYAPPSANLVADEAEPAEFTLTGPRSVPAGRGWGWIADGFGYFKKNPGIWILTLIVGLLIMIAMSIVPIVGQLALMATSYVWAGGIMLGCHAQAQGRDFEVQYLFAGFKNNAGKLILLSVVVAIVSMVVMVTALGPLYLQLLTGGVEQNPELIESIANPAALLLPLLVASLIFIPLTMAIWFAPALIAINDVPVMTAVKLSFFGCLKNVLPFLIYGIIALVLYILAAIPLLLGLLVFFPTIVASIYVSYKDIFLEASD